MSPRARSKQHHRLWLRTYIRKATRKDKAFRAFAQECEEYLRAWAQQQDGSVANLPSVQLAIYLRHRTEPRSCST